MFSVYGLLQKILPAGRAQTAYAVLKDKLIREQKAAKAEINELIEDFNDSKYSDRVNAIKELVKAANDYADAGLLHADANLLDPVSGRPQGHFLVPFFANLLQDDKDPTIRGYAAKALGHLGKHYLGNVTPILAKAQRTEVNCDVLYAIDDALLQDPTRRLLL